MLPALIPVLAPIISKVVGNLFPDPAQKAKAEQAFLAELNKHEAEIQQATASIIKAEAESEHWLTSTWRPITMLTFVAIIANNYILYPYLSLFWAQAPSLDLPPQMWSLLNIGVGGYIVSRGAEKVTQRWKQKS